MKSSSRRRFRVLSRRSVFRGRLVRLEILQIKTKSGRCYERELIKHPGAVVIIPRLPDGRLVLVHQLRVAVGAEIWELPAGTLEKGESALVCAQRELEEETGFRARQFRKLIEFFPTPGISNEKMILFLATGLRPSNTLQCDADEELRPAFFKERQVEDMIRRGRIIDGKTILGFLLYQKQARSQ